MRTSRYPIEAATGLDQEEIAEHIHAKEFDAAVGRVKFWADGERARPRMRMVRFRSHQGGGAERFEKPGRRGVSYPGEFGFGDRICPQAEAEERERCPAPRGRSACPPGEARLRPRCSH